MVRFRVSAPAVERLVLTAWVGGAWAAGYVVAPALFATIPERALAGTVAGEVFHRMSLVGLACGAVLLVLWVWRDRSGLWRGWRTWAVLGMLLATACGEWLLAPEIRALRAVLATGAMPELMDRFRWMHGAASLLFLAVSLTGLALVAAGPVTRAVPASASARGDTAPPPGL